MRLLFVSFFVLMLHSLSAQDKSYSVVLHGGAGSFDSKKFTPEQKENYNEFFEQVLAMADSMALAGDSAMKIVTAVIVKMEDSPMFNAGRGAVLTEDGHAELDASVMDGTTLKAGAVAGVRTIKNPVLAAQEVMLHSPHVFLTGRGAEQFAQLRKLEQVDSSYFMTDEMKQRYEKIKSGKNGTVGCVVRDVYGNIGAGTSTGGMMMKKWGRVGDSPVIGAGTYADSRVAGISCTGHGEYFIRYTVSYDIIARMKYGHQSLKDAMHSVLFDVLLPAGGTGGIIGVDTEGNIVVDFNTSGMFRASTTESGRHVIMY